MATQREKEIEKGEHSTSVFFPFQMNSNPTKHLCSSCIPPPHGSNPTKNFCFILWLPNGSLSQVQGELVLHNIKAQRTDKDPLHCRYSHSQAVFINILIHLVGNFFVSVTPAESICITSCQCHTHTHTHTNTSDVLTGQSSSCRHFIIMIYPVTHLLFYREPTHTLSFTHTASLNTHSSK